MRIPAGPPQTLNNPVASDRSTTQTPWQRYPSTRGPRLRYFVDGDVGAAVEGAVGVVVEGAVGAFWVVVGAVDLVVVGRGSVVVRAALLQLATVKAVNTKGIDRASSPFLMIFPPSSHYRTQVP